MAKETREAWPVIFLFAIVLSLHLFLSLQTNTMQPDAYFTLRQAEAIKATGLPIYNDPLSYSGRIFFFPPLFQYLVALFAFFFETGVAAKLVSAISLSLVAVAVYLICKHITKNRTISLIAALFSGLTPAMYFELNNPSADALSIPIILFLAYAFLRIEEENMATLAVILAALSLLTSVDLLLFIAGILFYYVVLFLESTKATRKEAEMTVFLFFLAIWFNILLYKKAFLNNGIATLWANLPAGVLSTYFQGITFIELLAYTGFIPIVLGVFAIYNLVFETKSKSAQLFIGLAIASFGGLWLKIIPIKAGLLFFSTSMIILSAYTMKSALAAAQKTKFPALPKLLAAVTILIFLAASLPPVLLQKSKEAQYAPDIEALKWISKNTSEDAVVLASVDEGFIVNYYAQRKNVADSNFIFIRDAEETYNDITQLFSLRLSSEAIRLLNKHGVEYIFISKRTKENSPGIMPYLDDANCFAKVLEGEATVYQFKGCKI